MPSHIKTSLTFLWSWLAWNQIPLIVFMLMQKAWEGGITLLSFWHNILGSTFQLLRAVLGNACIHSFHISRWCYFLCCFIRRSNKANSILQPFKGPAGWRGISDVISVLINEKLGFQVAGPIATIQFEWGQEGHLSLAARWPKAKPVEEPCSLHPVTGT